jgi:diacylglycerol kinase
MKEALKHHSKRFVYPVKGILFALRNDRSYRLQVYSVASLLAVFVYFMRPLNQTEILFIALAYTLVLITELQNSSFEAALDRMHPEMHDDIGRSKDMAAGAVLTAGFFLLFVLFIVWKI